MLVLKKSWGESTLTLTLYLLFFLTPLLFEFQTRELFEFPKMIFIYLGAGFLTYFYLLFRGGSLPKPSPFLKPFLLFLFSQALSTIFSTDLYSSVWGYYSRFNGGLISVIAFLLIFLTLNQTLNTFRLRAALIALLSGGFLISSYAFLQSLGLDKDFWIQDSQARTFATLGQPNWLAAYLLTILPLAFYFYLKAEGFLTQTVFFCLTLLFYFAFWSTYSLSGFFGFGFLVCLIVVFSGRFVSEKWIKTSILVLACVFLSLLRPGIFGVKIESFIKTLGVKITSIRPSQVQATNQESSTVETDNSSTTVGTRLIDTGDIRLSVWQGAFNLWASSPKNSILGTGPETFAYNFLSFRPRSLNQTTEWDFLYNKAHNYYLDLLSGSGLLGLLSFLLFSFSVFVYWWRKIKTETLNRSSLSNFIFYGWTTTLVTNFFGWPTVSLSLLFFTYPVLMSHRIENNPTENPDTQSGAKTLPLLKLIICSSPLLLYFILVGNIFLADVSFSQGLNYSQRGQLPEAESSLRDAVFLNFWEPAYHRELSFVLAQASRLEEKGPAAENLALASAAEAWRSEALNPKNSLTLRSLVRTFYLLSRSDPRYRSDLEKSGRKIVTLSPTDPQARYDLALVYLFLEKKNQALKLAGEALSLRPDFPEAQELLKKLNKND